MPALKINTKKIVENFNSINKLCFENQKELMVITKCIKSNAGIVAGIAGNGAAAIGDTSAANLKNTGNGIKKMLMKVPCSIKDISDGDIDIFYLSEMKILKKLSDIAGKKTVNAILPIELGELREGIPLGETEEFIREALKIKNVNIMGISGNFGCLAGLMPDMDKFEMLIDISDKVRKNLGYEFEIISVGGTVTYDYLKNNEIPRQINHIRMGEAIFTGQNTSMNSVLNGLYHDAFILSGEILELKYKETNISGNYGLNAFGEKMDKKSLLANHGIRKRAVVDFGFLSNKNEKLRAVEDGIYIVGNSHDFTVVDIEEAELSLNVGDYIDFCIDYNTVSYAMMSAEIDKIFVK